MPARQQICHAAAERLRSANPGAVRTVVGFDGFLDDIIEVVDKRSSHLAYERLETISLFAQKIAAAANHSANFELVVCRQKLGGNGPIMANAIASLGLATTCIGNMGTPEIHPVFLDLCRGAEVISVAAPAHTSALEFLDGKLMLGDLGPLSEITWPQLMRTIGKARLIQLVDRANLLAMVNWTMLPHMTSLWRGLMEDVLPHVSGKARRIFIDLADPQKRLLSDLQEALVTLQALDRVHDVMLGLNAAEAVQVAAALGLSHPSVVEEDPLPLAVAIQKALGIALVVVHPRKGAAAAARDGAASFAGPFIEQPKISTGAGDHFNAGFASAQLLGLSLQESLAAGTACSGFYVRTARSPTVLELADFLAELPEPAR